MKNKTSFFLVVALVSLFTGCKEDSSVDIDGPDKPFSMLNTMLTIGLLLILTKHAP